MMNRKKDKTLIPTGRYCYKFDDQYDGQKLKEGTVPTVYCPYGTTKEFFGVNICWCEYLEKGGLDNHMLDEDFNKLVEGYGSEDKVFEKFDLDLLWDGVKECGGNNNEEEKTETTEWIKKIKKLKKNGK